MIWGAFSFNGTMCQVMGFKGKTMEGEVDPNAVTQEARSGEQTKGELYLKADQKNKSRQMGTKGKVATKDETK